MIIGIPVYKNLDGLIEVIDSLASSTVAYNKVILLISDADDEMKEYCSLLTTKYEIIYTEKLGPLKAYNQLFQIAKERKEDLFLTQTDVYFPECKKDWLQEMINISKNEDCGLVTCWGGGGISGPDFIDGFRWVGAWCTYIPYRTIEKLGGYDEQLPLGWGVDIDYTYAVHQLGLKTYMIDYWVHHIPNYIDNHEHEKVDNQQELVQEAFRYMREKWKVGEYKK